MTRHTCNIAIRGTSGSALFRLFSLRTRLNLRTFALAARVQVTKFHGHISATAAATAVTSYFDSPPKVRDPSDQGTTFSTTSDTVHLYLLELIVAPTTELQNP